MHSFIHFHAFSINKTQNFKHILIKNFKIISEIVNTGMALEQNTTMSCLEFQMPLPPQSDIST